MRPVAKVIFGADYLFFRHRLNDGLEPCIDDVDFVMNKADVIGDGMIHKPELVQAISIWYSIDSEEKIKHHAHRQHASKDADEREEQVRH